MKKTIFLTILLNIPTLFFSQKTEMIFLDGDFNPTKKKVLIEYYRKVIKTDSGYYVRDFFMNDQLQMSGLFSDKELKIYNGCFKWYLEDGTKSKEAKFVDDLYQGKVFNYHKNGKIKSSEMFIDGKNHGRSVFYYNDGLEETKYDNKDDKIVGEYISYFPNSKVYAKAQFVNGNVVGKAQRYYQNEYILTDIEIDNQGNGIGIHYNEDGTIKEKVYFVGGFRRDASVVENEKKSKNEDVFRFNDVTNFFFEEFFYYDTDRVFFEIPTKDAEFKGGSYEMQKWIANNVRYPQKAIDNNVSNKVYVSFIVEANGSISTINIEEGYKIFQEEVIRLIESMPNWIPGEYNGKKVRVKCRLPINFKLY